MGRGAFPNCICSPGNFDEQAPFRLRLAVQPLLGLSHVLEDVRALDRASYRLPRNTKIVTKVFKLACSE